MSSWRRRKQGTAVDVLCQDTIKNRYRALLATGCIFVDITFFVARRILPLRAWYTRAPMATEYMPTTPVHDPGPRSLMSRLHKTCAKPTCSLRNQESEVKRMWAHMLFLFLLSPLDRLLLGHKLTFRNLWVGFALSESCWLISITVWKETQ